MAPVESEKPAVDVEASGATTAPTEETGAEVTDAGATETALTETSYAGGEDLGTKVPEEEAPMPSEAGAPSEAVPSEVPTEGSEPPPPEEAAEGE